MTKSSTLQALAFLAIALLLSFSAIAAPPSGFIEETIPRPDGGSWNEAVGLTFLSDGKMLVWERKGRVWVVDESDPLPNPPPGPLLDIAEEVGGWRDYGLLGVATHPNFYSNGYIYLLYVVDRHHLLHCNEPAAGFGVPECDGSYSLSTNEYFAATIGRITRYTVDFTNGMAIDYNSRKVLLGEAINSGIPILHQSHGTGSLVFGTDGTLLASTGDGASYSTTDSGSANGTYYVDALADGIIRQEENVGAFRSQMLGSLDGKILRLDPATGDGLPSNPFYDSADPRSPKSRTWALGLRNPFRMTLRPNTGSHDPADGMPGTLYIGDVGWGTWEDINVSVYGAENFGWPIYEGMTTHSGYSSRSTENQDAPNPLFGVGGCTQEFFEFRQLIIQDSLNPPSYPNPCNSSEQIPTSVGTHMHTRPSIDYRHGSDVARWPSYDATTGAAVIMSVGGGTDDFDDEVVGSQFPGNSSTGGVWYTGTDFPEPYQDTYFHADYGSRWIRNFEYDAADKPREVRTFDDSPGGVVALGTSPTRGHVYFISWGSTVKRVIWDPAGNRDPVAVASADVTYGDSPLTVQFTGDGSSDPDGNIASYAWDFGDGNQSTAANPQHNFVASGGAPESFSVVLTVTDDLGATDSTSILISTNNSPPSATITSPVDGTLYPLTGDTTYDLLAVISDAEHSNPQISCSWETILHHNNHTHTDPPDTNCSSTTVISPLGCGEETYFFRVALTVTDPEGLTGYDEVTLLPDCSVLPPDVTDPTPPDTVDATALSSSSIRVSWSGATDDRGVTDYNIYRDGDPTPVGNTAASEFTDIGLTPNTMYSYTVTALDAAGNESVPSVAAMATTPPPPAWLGTDIGAVAAAGSFTDNAGVVTVQASGKDIWGSADEFHYVYQTLDGDGEMTVRVASLTNTHAWAKAGVMIRESLTAGSTHAMVVVTPSKGSAFQYRAATGGNTAPSGSGDGVTTAPVWLRLVREGDLISGYLSNDGLTWTLRDSQTIAMASSVFIGMAVTSHNDGTLTTAVFDSISTIQGAAPPTVTITDPADGSTVNQPDITAQYTLSGDLTDVNHMHVILDGSGLPNETDLDGSYPLTGLADGSHTLELQLAAAGHQVLATATSTFTVMGPDNTPPTAPTNLISTQTTETSVSMSWGASTDNQVVVGYYVYQGGQQIGSTAATSYTATGLAPDTDYSFTVTAYDGASPPNESGPSNVLNVRTDTPPPPDVTDPTPPDTVDATALSSSSIRVSWSGATDDRGVTDYNIYRDGDPTPVGNTAASEFTDIGLTPNTMYSYTVTALDAAGNESVPSVAAMATTPPPPAWLGTDIGAVAAAGSFTDNAGVVTVQASGKDIWGSADEFHYVYQTLDGDGEMTVRVASLTNTHAWAKAGVMIRETLADNSVHAFIALSSSNGAAFQYRTTTGGSTAPSGSGDGVTTAPVWLRLVREGDLISGYLSNDGLTWTLRDSQTIAMASSVFIGMAVTSHNDGTLTTAVFDSISTIQGAAPPTVTITDPADGSTVNQPDITAQYTLSGDLTDVNHMHVILDGSGLPNETDLDGSYPLTGLADGSHTLELQLAAAGHQVLATATSTFTVMGPDNTPPTAPTNLISTQTTETSVSMSWGASTDNQVVVGYYVYQGGQQIGSTAATSYTATGLAPDTDYSFTVTAYDGASPPNESGPSNVLNVRTDTPPPPDVTDPTPPDTVDATALSSSSIRVSWSGATDDRGVTDYNIYRDGDPTPVGNTAASEFTDIGLTPNTMYSYTVTALDAAGNESVPSVAAMATTPPPPAWLGTDIGAVAAAGSFTDNAGVVTVQASGKDIWGSADEFHYVYQTLDGDGEMTVRVASLTNTHAWAKAGVMIRETLADNSVHAFIALSSSNGAAFQYRTTTGGSTAPSGSGDGVTTAPVWLRLVREGDLISGYLSNDGLTWTLRDSQTIAMASSVFIGMAVTSHNDGVITTAVFDNVTKTGVGTEPDVTEPTAPSNLSGFAGYSTGFNAPTQYDVGTKPHSIEVADVNGDAIADLITANSVDTNSFGKVSILYGNADGTFDSQVSLDVGKYPKYAIAGDFNDDGAMDIASADQTSSKVSIILSNGDGTFQSRVPHTVCSKPHELAAADLNDDGALDLVVPCHARSDIAVLIGIGDGTFAAATYYQSGLKPHSVAIADYNQDLVLDLAIANRRDDSVSIFLGNGDGSFAVPVQFGVSPGPHSVRTADLNGDSLLDIATANDDSGSVSVIFGNGDGSFGAAASYSVGVEPKSIAIGDLNGDGILDLMASNTGGNYPNCCVPSGGDTVTILHGNGDGTFASGEDRFVGLTPFSAKVFDFNGDGRLDIATANWDDHQAAVLLASPASAGQISLSWDPSVDLESGVAAYRIYRDGGATPIAEVPITSFTDVPLTADTEFTYNVTAIDRASPPNESATSNSVDVRTLP